MFLSEEMCETTAVLFKETQNKDLPYCQRVWISVAVFFLFFFFFKWDVVQALGHAIYAVFLRQERVTTSS